MRQRMVFAFGLACALILAWWTPTLASSNSCQAFTAYGDCYIELTGCDGDCDFNAGQGGEGWLQGSNCTGAYGVCTSDWYYELGVCGGGGSTFYCTNHTFRVPLIN